MVAVLQRDVFHDLVLHFGAGEVVPEHANDEGKDDGVVDVADHYHLFQKQVVWEWMRKCEMEQHKLSDYVKKKNPDFGESVQSSAVNFHLFPSVDIQSTQDSIDEVVQVSNSLLLVDFAPGVLQGADQLLDYIRVPLHLA